MNIQSMLLGLATLTAVTSLQMTAWAAKPNEKITPKPSSRYPATLEQPARQKLGSPTTESMLNEKPSSVRKLSKPDAKEFNKASTTVLIRTPVNQIADATPGVEADISRNLNRLRQLMNPDIATRIDAISNPELIHFLTQGWASWYGPGFQGEQTASGEIYDQNAMTAAHKSLPFGTLVRVTNLENGLSTVVRINDRGPYIEDREIDLSEAAAQILGTVQSGVAPVKLELLN